jgi:hypothetical protein
MGDSFQKRWSTEEVLNAVEGDVADEGTERIHR